MRLLGRLAAAALVLVAAAAAAQDAPMLRVGTSGDYPPWSSADPARPEALTGFDVAAARRFAAERGLRLEWVRFRWPDLVRDLEAGRFDVAMSGVTVRPERSLAGRFTVPVAETGAVALVRDALRFRTGADLDAPGVRIAVNAGGHLERVARRLFPRARVLAIADNAGLLDPLLAGGADAALSDDSEAPGLLARARSLHALGPLSLDRKAWLVRADERGLAADLDRWLFEREADGTLAALRRAELPPAAAAPPLSALRALLAAVDERLALMPLVAEAKRGREGPLREPAREQAVLDRGVASVRAAAREAGVAAPSEAAVRAFFAAQIEAGVRVQEAVLARTRPADGPVGAELAGELRPALDRIGERAARALVRLPAGLPAAEVRAAVAREIRAVELPPDRVDALANALILLTQ